MTIDNAASYADSLIEDMRARNDAGAPFGWVNEKTDEWSATPADDYREASASDYLRDPLDIWYIVGSDRQYIGARVCIAFGGPTAWIDTLTGQMEVTWWSAPEYRSMPREFIDGIDDLLAEVWDVG